MRTDKKKMKIHIEGMNCANCAAGIKKHLETKGLENVNVNFSTREASCNLKNNQSKKEVIRIIKKLGYTVIINNNKHQFLKIEKYYLLVFIIYLNKDSLK